jgi:hypothetical protein
MVNKCISYKDKHIISQGHCQRHSISNLETDISIQGRFLITTLTQTRTLKPQFREKQGVSYEPEKQKATAETGKVELQPPGLVPRVQRQREDYAAGCPNVVGVGGKWNADARERNADAGEWGPGWGRASRSNGPLAVGCGNRVEVVLGQVLEVVEPVGVEVETWVSTRPFVPVSELEDPASVPYAFPELD